MNVMVSVRRRYAPAVLLGSLLIAACSAQETPPSTQSEPVTVSAVEATAAPRADEVSAPDVTPAADSPPADEADASDAILNSAGAGRDPSLPIAEDPAAQDALIGGWASSREACNSGEALRFGNFGGELTFSTEGDTGTWTLVGDVLTITLQDGTQSRVDLYELDARQLSWRSLSGSVDTFVRCPD